jgi:uncharacterized YigZ family protein
MNGFDRTYKTILEETSLGFISMGSKFIAHAFPVTNELEIKTVLSKLKLNYPDATHHCYAWILNHDKSVQRLNDDGEPANTAARPMLKYINALDLTNILVVVVRYFGGKKLGIPGLISAYGESTRLCLAKAKIITKTLQDYYQFATSHEKAHLIYNLCRKHRATILEVKRYLNLEVVLSIEGSKTEALIADCEILSNFEFKYLKTE